MAHTTGQALRKAREARRIGIEQAAQVTRIRQRYLEALEADRFEDLPSQAQARGFLRVYAQYLKLDAEAILAMDGMSIPESANGEAGALESALNEQPAPLNAHFAKVGERLRQQRELLGISLEEVERHTHLRMHYLQALEGGRMVDLPSPVQGRGMLQNYASFLGLQPDPLLLSFAEGLQAELALKRKLRPGKRQAGKSVARPNIFRRLLSSDLFIGGLLVIFLISFMLWGWMRISEIRSGQEPSPTAPSVAEVLAPSTATPSQTSNAPTQIAPAETLQVATSTVQVGEEGEQGDVPGVELTLTNTPQSLEATMTQVALSAAPVQVYLAVRQRAWMRIVVDGKVEFEGRVLPGSAYLFSGDQRVEVLTGNGAALQIFYNRTDMGLMGIIGQVVERIYTRTGAETPTPTITPFGTLPPTPLPALATATPSPTATP